LATSKAAYQFVGIISAILFASCQKRGRLEEKRNYTLSQPLFIIFRPLFFLGSWCCCCGQLGYI